MNKPVSIALLVVGLIVLFVGLNASHSFASETSSTFTGSPTDKALWLMIGGGAAAVVGLVGLAGVFGPRRVT